MEISKVTLNSIDSKIKNNKILTNSAILAGSASLGVGSFMLIDSLGQRKQYKKALQQEKDVFEQSVQDIPEMKSVIPSQKTSGAKSISFTGIVDEIADTCTKADLARIQAYVNGKDPDEYEKQQSEIISEYRIDRDWPKGLNEENLLRYGDTGWLPKPKTDREYQEIILSQLIEVPERPPMYYRGYDRLFNTARWQEQKKWPEYIQRAAAFERMMSLIDKARVQGYARERLIIEQAAKKEITAACIKHQLDEEILMQLGSDSKKIKLPNAVMIQSKNSADAEQTMQWLITKADANYVFVEDKNDSNYVRLNQIMTVLERAQENYSKNGKRTIVRVENFDKMLSDNVDNADVIGDIKDLLDKVFKTYNSIILFDCSDTTKLNPITLQPHRTKIYNIDREVSDTEFRNFQNSYVIANIKKLDKTDGYRYNYRPSENEYVDLYLGDFGFNSNVLWVETQKAEVIDEIVKSIDAIKTFPLFKGVKVIRFPEPDLIDYFDKSNLAYTGKITKDYKKIYEYRL